VSYSAMAGAIGGGGLGDIAIRYGYQRFQLAVMLETIVILVIMVQLIQYAGNQIASFFDHKA
ncbi:MAG: D-methionine transport system permease protein, partial [Halanaerobium sp. T82-1]